MLFVRPAALGSLYFKNTCVVEIRGNTAVACVCDTIPGPNNCESDWPNADTLDLGLEGPGINAVDDDDVNADKYDDDDDNSIMTSSTSKPACPECRKVYSSNSNLKQHIMNMHAPVRKVHVCSVCRKRFKTKQYLQVHLLSMHGIRKRQTFNPIDFLECSEDISSQQS